MVKAKGPPSCREGSHLPSSQKWAITKPFAIIVHGAQLPISGRPSAGSSTDALRQLHPQSLHQIFFVNGRKTTEFEAAY